MFERIRSTILPLLRVPAEPRPPAGAPGSLRVFRAGRNYYRLRVVLWSIKQIATFVGIVISLSFLLQLKGAIAEQRQASTTATQQSAPSESSPQRSRFDPSEFLKEPRSASELQAWAVNAAAHKGASWPRWIIPVVGVLEVAGILFYIVQIPITYALLRLDFESHWYMVTDRSLRIRTGIMRLQESTMSFANVQQVAVNQGPLQRLLGIADLRVQSAGGGEQEGKPEEESMHAGIFQGVDNATQIRDLIVERLRNFRASGLGDPDDEVSQPVLSPTAAVGDENKTAAARALLEAVRELRTVIPVITGNQKH